MRFGITSKLLARFLESRQSHEGAAQVVKRERIIGAEFQNSLKGLDSVIPQRHLQLNRSQLELNVGIVRRIFLSLGQQGQNLLVVSTLHRGAGMVLQNAH